MTVTLEPGEARSERPTRRLIVGEQTMVNSRERRRLIRPMCLERRLKPRIYDDFVAKVRGIDASQERFVEHTVVENLSASGLYMKLPRRVGLEARILIILHLLFPSVEPEIELLVAFRGVVIREEQQCGQMCGVAIRFTHYRFLSKESSESFFETLALNGDILPT